MHLVRAIKRSATWLMCAASLVILFWTPTRRTPPAPVPHGFTGEDDNLMTTRRRSGDINQWLDHVRGTSKKPNVLFIIVDDMRPDLGVYSGQADSPWLEPIMHTPHMDSLAAGSILFRKAYCQQAWCNPSRSSLLTSRRPDTTMVHNNSVFFRQNMPNVITMPQYFKDNGYFTLAGGKVFHMMRQGLKARDETASWSIPNFRNHPTLKEKDLAWWAVPEEILEGKKLLDETLRDFMLVTLEQLAEKSTVSQQPFFLAMGVKKPHLPFIFPERYLDLYPTREVSMPKNPSFSSLAPDAAWFKSDEIAFRKEYLRYTKITWGPNQTMPSHVIRGLRRAYYSSISYIDDLIGETLEKLHNVGLSNDTVVALIGDHGYHLGEHGIVGKNTNFEVANRSPMMIRVPGVTDSGFVTQKLVEFVDLFPTMVDLTGLPSLATCPADEQKSRQVDICTEGTSLVPLLQDTEQRTWKERVFYQYPRVSGNGDLCCMGYSLRTPRYRFTEWVSYRYRENKGADWNSPCGTELYNHDLDPSEEVNLANDPAYAAIKSELSQQLRAGWYEAQPGFEPQ